MSRPHERARASFWIAALAGWAVIGYGIHGLVGRFGVRGAVDVGAWVVGGNVVHDAIVAPAALAVAAGVAWFLPRPWRAPLLAGLGASAVVVAVAYPALRGFGRKANNPSVLPLDYGTGVATVVAVVWGIVLAWYLVLLLTYRRTRVPRGSHPAGARGIR